MIMSPIFHRFRCEYTCRVDVFYGAHVCLKAAKMDQSRKHILHWFFSHFPFFNIFSRRMFLSSGFTKSLERVWNEFFMVW